MLRGCSALFHVQKQGVRMPPREAPQRNPNTDTTNPRRPHSEPSSRQRYESEKEMSHLPGNPHHALSEAAQTEHGAQVHATLALAYEQRTANLIALASINPEWYGSASTAEFDAIHARLGLGELK